jgi:acyl-CoA thioesterase
VVRQYSLLDILDSAASLSHTVIFHEIPEKWAFRVGNERKWYYLETGSKRVSDGRVLHKGRIYDANGNHLISTMQDGAIRLRFNDDEEKQQRQMQIQNDSKL